MAQSKGSFSEARSVEQNYEYDHFAGSQISIYIGDVLIDEINHIQFEVQQTKKPIYGYASQYYDAMASGQVLVTGNFAINFKEAGYMYLVLKRYLETIGPAQGGEVSPFDKDADTNPSIQNAKILRRNIERIIADELKETNVGDSGQSSGVQDELNAVGRFDKFQFYQDLAALPDNEFENMAEVFEDALWKDSERQGDNTGNIVKSTNLQLDQSLRRADQFPGFTIWIAYGDINNRVANHTIRKLTDVHIIGSGQVLDISGEPVIERYQFIARNLL